MTLGRRPSSTAPPAASSYKVGLRQMLGITAGHAANDVFVSFLAPLLPLFIARLGLTHAQAGLLSLVKETPSLLQPAIGHCADRLNLRALTIVAPTITAVLISLTGSARSYLMLALLLWLAGLSSAAFHSVTPAIAGRLSAGSAMGRSMGLWIFGGELGFALGPLLVVTVVERFGLVRMPYLSVMGLAGTAVLLFSLRDLRPEVRSSHDSTALGSAVHAIRPILAPLLALGSARALALSTLGSYLPTYLSESGTGFWLSGASLTVYQAAASVGVLIGGALSDRVGRRRVMFASMVLTPACLLAFLALNGLPRILTLLAVGLVAVTFDPAALAIIQEGAVNNRGLASSVYLSLTFLIRSVAVVAAGLIGDWIGLRWSFAIGALALVAGAPLVWLLPGPQALNTENAA